MLNEIQKSHHRCQLQMQKQRSKPGEPWTSVNLKSQTVTGHANFYPLLLADLNDTDKPKAYNGFTLHMSECMAQRVRGPEFTVTVTVTPRTHTHTPYCLQSFVISVSAFSPWFCKLQMAFESYPVPMAIQ